MKSSVHSKLQTLLIPNHSSDKITVSNSNPQSFLHSNKMNICKRNMNRDSKEFTHKPITKYENEGNNMKTESNIEEVIHEKEILKQTSQINFQLLKNELLNSSSKKHTFLDDQSDSNNKRKVITRNSSKENELPKNQIVEKMNDIKEVLYGKTAIKPALAISFSKMYQKNLHYSKNEIISKNPKQSLELNFNLNMNISKMKNGQSNNFIDTNLPNKFPCNNDVFPLLKMEESSKNILLNEIENILNKDLLEKLINRFQNLSEKEVINLPYPYKKRLLNLASIINKKII